MQVLFSESFPFYQFNKATNRRSLVYYGVLELY